MEEVLELLNVEVALLVMKVLLMLIVEQFEVERDPHFLASLYLCDTGCHDNRNVQVTLKSHDLFEDLIMISDLRSFSV